MKNFLLLVISYLLLVSGAQAVNYPTADPLKIGMGARAMGMGRAFVAVAEDADTVFVNPAGLGGIKTAKLNSMYTSLMGDVNYVVLGGAYPFGERSAIGAGIVNANVGGIDLYSGTGVSLGTGSWSNSVIFASYGMRMPDDKLKFGGSVKYYTAGGSGLATIESAAGSGFGLDAGALYSVNDNLNLGVSLQNPLGTKIESGNGVSNSLPTAIKLGAAYTMPIGESQKLNLAGDYDLNGGRSNTAHLGAEYFLSPMLILRAGLDQDLVPGGVDTNMCAGLGLRVQGVAFDFAYHPYSSLSENTTYYFSVGYVGPTEPKELELTMAVKTPADKSTVYDDHVAVTGTLTGKNITGIKVAVNEINASVNNDGTFTASVPVDKLGKKLIHVEASDSKGRKITEDRRVLRLVSFNDVTTGHWAKSPIENTGTVGLVEGYPDKTFRPDRSLTRAELAALLVRAKGYKMPGKPIKVFKDVASNHWSAGYVEIARRTGMIKGYPDGRFRPNNRINRAEAITVLARFDGLNKKYGKTAFADVKSKHWSAGYVNAAEEAGMLSWVSESKLEPAKAINRAESVKMLSGTSLATKLIDDLLSWDKGFQFEITRPTIRATEPIEEFQNVKLSAK